MDEFIVDHILSSQKHSEYEPKEETKGNIHLVRWGVILDKYMGKLAIEANYVPGVEIRVSFMEVYDKIPLRRLEIPLNSTKKYNHRNPKPCGNTELITGMHKHKFDNKTLDRCAYVPNDIDPTNNSTIIRTFAEECKILFVGYIPNVLVQKELYEKY